MLFRIISKRGHQVGLCRNKMLGKIKMVISLILISIECRIFNISLSFLLFPRSAFNMTIKNAFWWLLIRRYSKLVRIFLQLQKVTQTTSVSRVCRYVIVRTPPGRHCCAANTLRCDCLCLYIYSHSCFEDKLGESCGT